MDRLHPLGLLLLNFGLLNILLSLIFFLIASAGRRLMLSPRRKSRLLFLSLIAPPALSSFTIFTSFVPPFLVKIPGKAMFCLNEPYCYIFSFVSPEIPLFNGLMVFAAGLAMIPVISSIISLRSYSKVHGAIHHLTSSPRPLSRYENIDRLILKELKEFGEINKINVRIIDTRAMISFIWGYISNVLIISTGVLKTLSADELRGVLDHELTHCKRRDNILKGFLLLCRNSLFIFPHVHFMFRWWGEEIELIGDEEAAMRTGKPLDVASALLKMKADVYPVNTPDLALYTAGFSVSPNNGLLTHRVERLLAINDGKVSLEKDRWQIIPSETVLLLGMTSMFPASFAAIYEFDPLLVHCALEKLLSFFLF